MKSSLFQDNRPLEEAIRQDFEWMVGQIQKGEGICSETSLDGTTIAALNVYMMRQTSENLSDARQAMEDQIEGLHEEYFNAED